MKNKRSITRRGFLKGVAVAGAVVAIPQYISATALGKDGATAASDRIAMGFIGTGLHGVGMNLQAFLRLRDSQVVALCDVDRARMVNANNLVKQVYGNGFKGCFTTGDWREVIA
ncbi:MAG: twin-arginine translocation signal domain-containing protein, partial [bacterium]|nr:twin-arginine translocation signal domain-containing protein [bacterium]